MAAVTAQMIDSHNPIYFANRYSDGGSTVSWWRQKVTQARKGYGPPAWPVLF